MKKLKSAEELYSQLLDECPWSVAISKSAIKPYILELVKIAQIDTIKTTAENCAKDAKLDKSYNYGSFNYDLAVWEEDDKSYWYKESYGHGDCGYEARRVSKQSILNVADKMIKEL